VISRRSGPTRACYCDDWHRAIVTGVDVDHRGVTIGRGFLVAIKSRNSQRSATRSAQARLGAWCLGGEPVALSDSELMPYRLGQLRLADESCCRIASDGHDSNESR
jgi:hypothetical protein